MESESIKDVISDYLPKGEDPTEDDVINFKVLMEALAKFHERDKEHKGLWKTVGYLDPAFHMRHKALRSFHHALNEVPGERPGLDDPIDLINYCVFFIRNVREDRPR